MSSMISNVVESFVPIIAVRNYAPTRTFVTKWDVEIENNRAKKKSRNRDRDTKYSFDQDFDYGVQLAQLVQIETQKKQSQAEEHGWEKESSDDGEGEETRQGWLRSIEAENAYYERKYGRNLNFDWYDMNEAELDTDQGNRKRTLLSEEESDFKRVRA